MHTMTGTYHSSNIVYSGTICLGTRVPRKFVRGHIVSGRPITPPILARPSSFIKVSWISRWPPEQRMRPRRLLRPRQSRFRMPAVRRVAKPNLTTMKKLLKSGLKVEGCSENFIFKIGKRYSSAKRTMQIINH